MATIGPASASVTMLTRMMKAGMDIARLNFSHGTHKAHAILLRHIRAAAKKSGRTVAVLQDLQGTKIRIGILPEEGIELKKGKVVTLTYTDKVYDKGHIPVTYNHFHKDVKKGHRIFLDDGFVELNVQSVRGKIVKAKVIQGGHLISHKGINIPDSQLSTNTFTKKDHEDLIFGLNNHVDWIALSFVTSAKTVINVRKIMKDYCIKYKLPVPRIMVKIERREAVDAFLEIVDAADGILLARGDLGIELPYEEVPIIQKEFTEICRATGKPIIIATHMLESMKDHRRATRAEVSDIANAVMDHADATMLSAETATGDYPYASVQVMETVIRETEASRMDDISFYQTHNLHSPSLAIAQAVHTMAENRQIDFIVLSANYKTISEKINVFRPNVPILMACSNASQARQLTMKCGVQTFILQDNPGTFIHRAEGYLHKHKIVSSTKKIAFVTETQKGELQLTIR